MKKQTIFILFFLYSNAFFSQSKAQIADSLFRIATYYHNGYYLENQHDTFFLKKAEAYYLLTLNADSTNKKAYIGITALYENECLYYLSESEGSKKHKIKMEKLYDFYISKFKKYLEQYVRILKEENINDEEYNEESY